MRTILKKIPQLPYTVFLLILGALLGLLGNYVESVHDYTKVVDMEPHTLLHVFLPVLIFESAYAMEAHTFMRSFIQIVVLAVPGLCKFHLLQLFLNYHSLLFENCPSKMFHFKKKVNLTTV